MRKELKFYNYNFSVYLLLSVIWNLSRSDISYTLGREGKYMSYLFGLDIVSALKYTQTSSAICSSVQSSRRGQDLSLNRLPEAIEHIFPPPPPL